MSKNLQKFRIRHQLMHSRKKNQLQRTDHQQNILIPKFMDTFFHQKSKIKSQPKNYTIQHTGMEKQITTQIKQLNTKQNSKYKGKYYYKEIKSIDVQQSFRNQKSNVPPFSNTLILQKVFPHKMFDDFNQKPQMFNKNLAKLMSSRQDQKNDSFYKNINAYTPTLKRVNFNQKFTIN